MKISTIKPLIAALSLALPAALAWSGSALAADADSSNAAILKELQELKAKVKELEDKLNAPKEYTAEDEKHDMEFARVKIKVDQMQSDNEDSGFSGLKISGYVDPTFIQNQRRSTSSFSFLNSLSSSTSASNPTGINSFGYDNSYFGTLMLHVEKTFENGGKGIIEIMPKKGYDEGNANIVNQANFSLPINNQLKVFAGQIQSFEGYEYQGANQRKNITYNLLFDYAEFTYVTGAGVEWVPIVPNTPWDLKLMVGNPAVHSRNYDGRSLGLHGRFDYALDEYTDIGGSFYHGKAASIVTGRNEDYNTFETDFNIAKGDWTYSGQLSMGKWKNAASNGGDASWTGLSLLTAYKFTPRNEGVIRLDYIKNDKNGGGLIGGVVNPDNSLLAAAVFDTRQFGDPFGGFGQEIDPTTGLATDANKGANRYALTATYNYLVSKNTTLRMEYRFDGSTLRTFYDNNAGTYVKTNSLLGTQLLYTF